MTTGTVAIPTEPTSAEDLAPGALSAYAADLVPIYRRQAGLPDRQEWTTLAGIANALAASDMLPKGLTGRAKNVMAVILKGRDLGLSPTEAVWGIDMIEGMPTLKSHTMSALIKRAGHRLWYENTSRESATIVGQRLERWRGDGEPVYGPEIRLTWTIDDAIDAHLVTREANGKLKALSKDGKKKPWMLYPAAMLRARALTAIARMEFSDVLMGAWYSPEELGAEIDGDGKVIRLPQGQEAVAAFEQTLERQSQHTGGDQSERRSQGDIRDGQELSGMLHPDTIEGEVIPPQQEEPPPTREELCAELAEQARVLAGGSVARFTTRAVAAYKTNAEEWTDAQIAEFVQSRRASYYRHIEEHPDLAPETPEPWKATPAADEVPTSDGSGPPAHRTPYVGEGAEGARRSAQIDREEADMLPLPGQPGYGVESQDRRAALRTSADRWEAQADEIEATTPTEPADDPAPDGTEPADDPAPEGTEPADDVERDEQGRVVEDPPDTLV